MPANPNEHIGGDPVAGQYEQWPYPPPLDDLTAFSAASYIEGFYTLRDLTPIYWPAGQPREDLDILVAGCGTNAAACYAYLYPRCRVVGIDISRSSLAHEERLKARHNLANLTLHHCPIEDVATLGKTFDFISCHGVLHHMANPTEGLRALGGVLNRDGVAGIMVYGRYGRMQVYVYQELFRVLGLKQSPDDVAVVRETLAALPPDHFLRHYLSRAIDLNEDPGLVDTFLHRRDRAFSVAECLEMVKDAGLAFQGWDQNLFYYPDGIITGTPLFRQRLDRLPEEQVWQAMELCMGLLGMHWFHVCRKDRDPAGYRLPWDSPRLFDCVPLRFGQLVQLRAENCSLTWAVRRAPQPPVPLSANYAAVVSQIDGRRTVRECLAAARAPGDDQAKLRIARDVFGLLWRTGNGALRLR